MPNVNYPKGLMPIEPVHRVGEYWAEVSTALAIGDAVRLNGNGRLVPAGAGQEILGCLMGITDKDGVPLTKLDSSNADTNLVCMVSDAIDQKYVIQMDDTDVSIDSVGKLADIAYGAADSLREQSTTVIDGGTVGSGAQLRLLGRLATYDNEYGPHCDWLVIITKSQLKSDVGTTMAATKATKKK